MGEGDPMQSGEHHLCMSRADDPKGLEFSL